MDPNEALRIIRTLVNNFYKRATYEDMDQLVESIEALDEWITSGGFLPDAWQNRA